MKKALTLACLMFVFFASVAQSAGLSGLITGIGGNGLVESGGGTSGPTGTTSRALNVNHAWTQWFEASGGTSFGRLSRIRLISPVAFQCVRAVYTTFYQAGTSSIGYSDTDYPAPFNVQTGIELPSYTQARTGIPVRTGATGAQLTWNTSGYGANSGLTWAYGGQGTNTRGYVVSDKYCAPSVVPANTEFGLWSSVEAQTAQPLTYAITALSSSGTTATASIANTTGLYVGEPFNVTGASVGGYNGQVGLGLSTGLITAIVANTSVSYLTSGSNLGAATTATGSPYILPANAVESSAFERYEGTSTATSSAGSFVATNAVANATSVSAWSTGAATGANVGFYPAFLLIDVPNSTKEVFVLGDSVDFGVSAGATTNVLARDGDSMGVVDHGISWLDRYLQYNAQVLYVNGGKGGDGARWLYNLANWKYRPNLIALANPTHVVNAMAYNDQAIGPAGGTWTATNSTYFRGTVVSHSGNYYVQLAGQSGVPALTCTTGATGPVGTTVGAYELDGTCYWAFIGAVNGSQYGQQGVAWNMVVNDILRQTVPSAKIYNTTMMPNATYNSSNYSVTAFSSSGNIATASIANTNLMVVGNTITVTGASVAGYNVQSTILSVTPNTSITYTTPGSNLGAATTGTVTTLVETLADQVANATNCATRNNFDTFMQTRQDLMGWTSVIDINPNLENNPVTHDCYWAVDNVTNFLLTFGQHPNSYGYGQAAAGIPAGTFQ